MPKTNASELEEQIDDLELASETPVGEKKIKTKNREEGLVLSRSKLEIIKSLLRNNRDNNETIVELLSGSFNLDEEARISIGQLSDNGFNSRSALAGEEPGEGRIVEGVFDGENMIGPDGKQYSVPANYASKSKLVEGDILKLTITGNGTFVYKQIGPIERARLIGKLEKSDNGNFIVNVDGKAWKVLTASVTYFKGLDGDEIIILVPKVGDSKWAAVENIVKKPA